MNCWKLVSTAILCLSIGVLSAQTKRRVRAADLPRSWTGSAVEFDRFIVEIARRTQERLREGEKDHLVAYILQSSQFTSEPRIEPALSAMEFVRAMAPAQRAGYLACRETPVDRVPASASQRMDAFLQARPRAGDDERIPYFQSLVAGRGKPYLMAAYAHTMRFLYKKEAGREPAHPPTDLYQERGYAADTQVEANFPVWTALSVLKSLEPSLAIHRVLIVGPGLDIAPRTGLLDVFPPQSYQPFAVADALLSLGLTGTDSLQIHCVDVNPLVVRFLEGFPRRRNMTLNLISGLRRDQLSSDFQEYFRNLGRKIGRESPLDVPEALASHLTKSLTVRQEVARSITAGEMNILTERYDPSPAYDLVVATNVLVYFNDRELRLALANIHSMLRPGGYLMHNELRPEVESLGRELALMPLQGRTIRISSGVQKPLLDSFAIQRRVDPVRK